MRALMKWLHSWELGRRLHRQPHGRTKQSNAALTIAEFACLATCACRAMQGDVSFEESLELRLGLMQPSKDQVQKFLQARPAHLSPGEIHKACCVCCVIRFTAPHAIRPIPYAGVADLIFQLHQRGTDVFLVSGGFRAIIHPIATTLNIPIEHVYANTILFKVRPNMACLLFCHSQMHWAGTLNMFIRLLLPLGEWGLCWL